MKTKGLMMTLVALMMCCVSNEVFAHDIEVKNADGVMIYYNYINDGLELEVTKGNIDYSNSVIIPEEVALMNRTRKVTRIGDWAFSDCSGLISITIPNSVTSIGQSAFHGCSGLTSIDIPNSVTSIGQSAFGNCTDLTSITIPNSVTSIGEWAFSGCTGLTSITIGNSVRSIGYEAFDNCTGLTSITIPESVTSIGYRAFWGCTGLTSITIPESVTSIGFGAFNGCTSLTSVTIPNSVTSIGSEAFYNCTSLTSVTIPNSVTSIGYGAFNGCDISTVISLIEEPFAITGKSNNYRTFSTNTFNNATLYVPVGTIDKYNATNGWKDFLFIEEGNGGGGGETPEEKVCEKPTIHYQNGKLTFKCATEGALCHSTITDSDIASYDFNDVDLTVTYHISVYATKDGYTNSETAKATLCWIDVEPQKEGITDEDEDAVAQVKAVPVLIQAEGNMMTINGATAGTPINVYDLNGRQLSNTTAAEGETRFNVVTNEKVVLVKVGEKVVKVQRR